jgi:enamine deaminase RidA (YjgF/YER057c/UK114 family)
VGTTVPPMDDRHRVSSGSPWELTVGYSRALRVGDRVFVAGTAPKWADGEVDPDPAEQARKCFEIISEALERVGSSLRDVVRTRMYLVDADDFEAIGAVHGEMMSEAMPVNTTVVVAGLLDPRWKIELEVEAVLPTDDARDRNR